MKNKQKIIQNIIWLALSHAIRIISTLISTSILAKVLGVEGYGMYQYIIGLIAVFSSLSYICGSEVIVPRLTTADAEMRKSIMGNGFFIRLLFSIIAYTAFIIFIFITENIEHLKIAVILGLPIVFNESFAIITAYLQSQTIIKYRATLTITGLIIRALLFLAMYHLGLTNILWYNTVLVLEAAYIALGLLWVYKKLTHEYFFSLDIQFAISLFKKGLGFFTGIILKFLFLRLDLIMLRHYTDEISLSLYASSLQLFNAFIIIGPIIAISFAPIYIYSQNNIQVIKKNIIKITSVLFFIALLMSITISGLTPIIINLVFGESFESAKNILKLLIWILPLYFINEGFNIYIIKMQLSKHLIYKWLTTLIVATTAYYILIPTKGSTGAIIGLGLAYIASCIFGFLIIVTTHKNSESKPIDF